MTAPYSAYSIKEFSSDLSLEDNLIQWTLTAVKNDSTIQSLAPLRPILAQVMKDVMRYKKHQYFLETQERNRLIQQGIEVPPRADNPTLQSGYRHDPNQPPYTIDYGSFTGDRFIQLLLNLRKPVHFPTLHICLWILDFESDSSISVFSGHFYKTTFFKYYCKNTTFSEFPAPLWSSFENQPVNIYTATLRGLLPIRHYLAEQRVKAQTLANHQSLSTSSTLNDEDSTQQQWNPEDHISAIEAVIVELEDKYPLDLNLPEDEQTSYNNFINSHGQHLYDSDVEGYLDEWETYHDDNFPEKLFFSRTQQLLQPTQTYLHQMATYYFKSRQSVPEKPTFPTTRPPFSLLPSHKLPPPPEEQYEPTTIAKLKDSNEPKLPPIAVIPTKYIPRTQLPTNLDIFSLFQMEEPNVETVDFFLNNMTRINQYLEHFPVLIKPKRFCQILDWFVVAFGFAMLSAARIGFLSDTLHDFFLYVQSSPPFPRYKEHLAETLGFNETQQIFAVARWEEVFKYRAVILRSHVILPLMLQLSLWAQGSKPSRAAQRILHLILDGLRYEAMDRDVVASMKLHPALDYIYAWSDLTDDELKLYCEASVWPTIQSNLDLMTTMSPNRREYIKKYLDTNNNGEFSRYLCIQAMMFHAKETLQRQRQLCEDYAADLYNHHPFYKAVPSSREKRDKVMDVGSTKPRTMLDRCEEVIENSFDLLNYNHESHQFLQMFQMVDHRQDLPAQPTKDFLQNTIHQVWDHIQAEKQLHRVKKPNSKVDSDLFQLKTLPHWFYVPERNAFERLEYSRTITTTINGSNDDNGEDEYDPSDDEANGLDLVPLSDGDQKSMASKSTGFQFGNIVAKPDLVSTNDGVSKPIVMESATTSAPTSAFPNAETSPKPTLKTTDTPKFTISTSAHISQFFLRYKIRNLRRFEERGPIIPSEYSELPVGWGDHTTFTVITKVKQRSKCEDVYMPKTGYHSIYHFVIDVMRTHHTFTISESSEKLESLAQQFILTPLFLFGCHGQNEHSTIESTSANRQTLYKFFDVLFFYGWFDVAKVFDVFTQSTPFISIYWLTLYLSFNLLFTHSGQGPFEYKPTSPEYIPPVSNMEMGYLSAVSSQCDWIDQLEAQGVNWEFFAFLDTVEKEKDPRYTADARELLRVFTFAKKCQKNRQEKEREQQHVDTMYNIVVRNFFEVRGTYHQMVYDRTADILQSLVRLNDEVNKSKDEQVTSQKQKLCKYITNSLNAFRPTISSHYTTPFNVKDSSVRPYPTATPHCDVNAIREQKGSYSKNAIIAVPYYLNKLTKSLAPSSLSSFLETSNEMDATNPNFIDFVVALVAKLAMTRVVIDDEVM